LAKKGGSRSLKRLASPITYRIPRKTGKWVVKSSPGPHPSEKSIPIAILLRDVLKIARNLREVKYILRRGYVKVDAKPIKSYKWPVGLMDVISLIPTDEHYRMLPAKKYLIMPRKIGDKGEARLKPLRIKVKTMIKGGRLQLTTHDGRNFVVSREDNLSKLKPGDVLVYDLVDKKVVETVKMDIGSLGLVIGGSKIGVVGRISGIRKVDPLKPRLVLLSTEEYGDFETVFDYVFPIGVEKPVVNVEGV